MCQRSIGLYVFPAWASRLLPTPAICLLSHAADFGSGYLPGAVIPKLPFFRWAVLGIGRGDKNGD